MRIRTTIVVVGGALLTASSLVAQNPTNAPRRTVTVVYFEPTSTTCTATVAMNDEVRKVKIKADAYDAATMISPDSAKAIALCNVPGQVTSGEMESDSTRAVYQVTVIPNKKKTHTKVLIDARTGQVLSVKQFGGARGFAGWVRESAEHKKNKAKSKTG
jgi:uncharacterized membrane protein YkoI